MVVVSFGQGGSRPRVLQLNSCPPSETMPACATVCPSQLCRGLMRATLHLVNREFEALADDFVTLGMLPKTEVGASCVYMAVYVSHSEHLVCLHGVCCALFRRCRSLADLSCALVCLLLPDAGRRAGREDCAGADGSVCRGAQGRRQQPELRGPQRAARWVAGWVLCVGGQA